MKREAAERRGRTGEWIAAWWLRLHGWRILGQRIRTRQGEIDLVARRRGLVAFVEVKTRAKESDLDFAVDEYRLRRVAAAARSLMPRYQRPGDDVRIDVILLAPRTWPRHIEGAWEERFRA